MKAYVTSVGEKTTNICVEQLRKFGFEVVLLGEKESWPDKYKRFLNMANEDCIRIDADVIPNKYLAEAYWEAFQYHPRMLIIQYRTYCFYKNQLAITSPLFYRKEALDILKTADIDKDRPEAIAWRHPAINDRTYTSDKVVGLHGFFQDDETFKRAVTNKHNRGQIDEYDFVLAEQLRTLRLMKLSGTTN